MLTVTAAETIRKESGIILELGVRGKIKEDKEQLMKTLSPDT